MTDATFAVQTASGTREVSLRAYLDRSSQEQATEDALGWIKALRHARVDGQSLRSRFRVRGDSLWWFAELYLHKQQVISRVFSALAALDALIERERPGTLQFVQGSRLVSALAAQRAGARGIAYRGPREFGRSSTVRLAALEARASALNAAALASRLRPRSAPRSGQRPRAAAFVHRAFWRADAGDGSAETYIGPVLSALERKIEKGSLSFVGLGPTSNFRARRWWHPLRGDAAGSALPIEAYAPLGRLADSRRVWRERHQNRKALWASADLREHAVIRRCDCWPIVQDELTGIALLQWPWSARAMDEAGAALDALQPGVAVTYAEAGGWGRALMLECRRRQIPSVGLQHGFIYRHWLNYRHEPDEMLRDPEDPADRGFPAPALTLLFDEYAARHLATEGRFPPDALKVTGSPRLDALASDAARLTPEDVDRALSASGVPCKTLVLVATKYREADVVLRGLVDAAAELEGVQLVIKAHPAETTAVYDALAAGRAYVTVLDAATPLAPLLRASRAVVTVNSTVALDAAVLDVPALVIGLPNNLSPFVEAGVMAGIRDRPGASSDETVGEIAGALRRILYDKEFQAELSRARRTFLARFHIRADGGAADRAADEIARLGQHAKVP